MFTGIVETTAKILDRSDSGLVLERPKTFDDIKIGSSIAISGTCLTVTSFDSPSMSFDVVPETWSRTKLGMLKTGNLVNLERALSANGRFEGHIVQGHIEGVATVASFEDVKEGWAKGGKILTVKLPKELLPFVVFKGSIALDGVSLTVAELKDDLCSIALIPHTLEITTLGSLKTGEFVNVETDILAKYLKKSL